ncbi:MAG: ATPase, T2SS/T4P/T4SS family [Planctomycetota bacterium]|nr:ATPase, T2SS/T4P/T4SS family [Planctomycetota bacterium]
MSNRFDELMQDLGIGKSVDQDPEPPAPPRQPTGRPDLSGSGLGPDVHSGVVPAPAVVRPDDALSELWTPPDGARDVVDLPSAVLEAGSATPEQVAAARRMADQSPGRPIRRLLIEAGADEAGVQQVAARLAGLAFERLEHSRAEGRDAGLIARLGADFCRDHHVLPLRTEGSRIVVGTTDPDDLFLMEDIKRRLGVAVLKQVVLVPSDIRRAVEALGGHPDASIDLSDLLADVEEDDEVEVRGGDEPGADLEAEADSSPVVRYVNHVIQTAVRDGASDIHIEPGESTLRIRFRIDGILVEAMSPPRKMHGALTSRIKIMSNLDIAERRLPQDGRISVTVAGRRMDLRVSTIPTPSGEKTVMRILDTRSIEVTLDELGFTDDALTTWQKQISQPHGIILVTGPTGSGKTTTLYASIRRMDVRRLNISTVEDPIEYHLEGITQIQTHDVIGLGFATALKSLLRQDPDVILLGEVRDLDTANTAVQAALTGHLVLSTLHTNDAPSSVTRLINIGIEPFLVGAALNSVLAQRLVRRTCPECSRPESVPEELAGFLRVHGVHPDTVRRGGGCPRCRETGYSGRCGIYELLVLDDFLRDRIASSPNVTEFRRLCIERGMSSLRDDGFAKIELGMTSVEEVLRVTDSTI